MTEQNNTLNEFEAADYVKLSVATLRKARQQGTRPGHISAPPYLKIGRRIRYLKQDLDIWLASHRIEAR